MLARKAFRYRIYPTPEQAARLGAWEDALRWLWNLAHEQHLLGLARVSYQRRYVPAAYSSQTCAVCGAVDTASRRSQSEFVCVACGHHDHADLNAAKVLLSRGIHGGAACGGSAEVGRPKRQELRVARRGTRRGSEPKAPLFRAG